MTMKLKLLCRVAAGEDLAEVLKDYPRLTEEEKACVRQLVREG